MVKVQSIDIAGCAIYADSGGIGSKQFYWIHKGGRLHCCCVRLISNRFYRHYLVVYPF